MSIKGHIKLHCFQEEKRLLLNLAYLTFQVMEVCMLERFIIVVGKMPLTCRILKVYIAETWSRWLLRLLLNIERVDIWGVFCICCAPHHVLRSPQWSGII